MPKRPAAAVALPVQPPADEDIRVGERLRWARMRQGRTIAEIAEATGLSKGFISQIERDLATPSVASLIRICDELGIRVGTLFEFPTANLVRSEERPAISFGGERIAAWMLTPASSEHLQVVETRIAPGGGSGDEPYTLEEPAEWVHVLKGRLEIVVSGEPYVLQEGDSLAFSPRETHTWKNACAGTTRLLWVLLAVPEL
jgi:transcriptional regulator with XRE-family HTH domain